MREAPPQGAHASDEATAIVLMDSLVKRSQMTRLMTS